MVRLDYQNDKYLCNLELCRYFSALKVFDYFNICSNLYFSIKYLMKSYQTIRQPMNQIFIILFFGIWFPPLSFSMTTKILSGVSNIRSRLTTPGWCRFCRIDTSFFRAASCFVGNRNLSITWKSCYCFFCFVVVIFVVVVVVKKVKENVFFWSSQK